MTLNCRAFFHFSLFLVDRFSVKRRFIWKIKKVRLCVRERMVTPILTCWVSQSLKRMTNQTMFFFQNKICLELSPFSVRSIFRPKSEIFVQHFIIKYVFLWIKNMNNYNEIDFLVEKLETFTKWANIDKMLHEKDR